MKTVFLLLASLLTRPALAAQAPAPAVPPPAAPEVAPPARAPTQEEIAESAAVIEAADTRRLVTDAAYAAEILRHLDRLAPSLSDDAEAAMAVDTLRLLALARLERRAEAEAVAQSILARRPTDPGNYLAPWITALTFEDMTAALEVIEAASREVPGVGWPRLRALFAREVVMQIFARFQGASHRPSRVRLAEALFRIGWPGENGEIADGLRIVLMEDRLDQNDVAGATGFAAAVTTPSSVLPLLVRKRYDALLAPNADRLALLGRALDERERETTAALAAAPRDSRRLLERAQHLRSQGRDADALAVLAPATRDVAATAAEEFGMWAVNEAAYALLALNRGGEAIRLMERIAAMPLERHYHLVSARINHLEVLTSVGRHAEALERAARLEAEGGRFASDYGKAWIDSTRVCALASLGRAPETEAPLARLRGWSEINAPALSRAYLCLNNLDAAAALLVQRLGRDDPVPAILALQDYRLSRGPGQAGPMHARFLSLRDRPEVRAALDRVGRVLSLPLARTYWGDF
ncbi:MAG TPA: hypothetical protein VEX35_02015 [Allosphingosinicella sp.]|nr:hypothetical protein [Allosphingosinicella sp.]